MKKRVALIALVCLLTVVVVPAVATDCSGICGDVNPVYGIDNCDIVYMSNYLFKGGPPPPCMDQADVNGDCSVDIGDFIYLFNYVWQQGPAPLCSCGQ